LPKIELLSSKQKVFKIENPNLMAAVKEVFEPKGLRKPKGEQNV
jgi:hypothetical protein